MKFVMLVEGQTEKDSIADFVRRGLHPRLQERVGVSVVRFKGFGDYLSKIKDRVEIYLAGKHADEIIAAIGLIDLCGPQIFPAGLSPAQKARWGKKELERQVGHPRFRQYFAVHETEAWLLAHKEVLPEAVRESLPSQCSQPETVNNNEPPSRLLGRLYQNRLNRPYRKVADGKNLFLRCDPEVAASRCPHFKEFLTDLEQMARAALQQNN